MIGIMWGINAVTLAMPTITNSSARAGSITRPFSLFEWLNWLNQNTSAAIALLLVVNLVCHWQTLGGFFLADDFVHVAYLQEVFNGHPELLLKNFYSTWLQTEGTNFYRPFISLTLAFDRLIFGASPLGYHITNFIYQCLSTIGLYLVVRELSFQFAAETDEKPQTKGVLILGNVYAGTTLPLITALLFAVHPLHSEVVSWIIARVDSVCCAFYSLSMWLFLKARRLDEQKAKLPLQIISYVFFIISLISKEMAVTLPPTLVLLMVLFPKRNEGEKLNLFSAAKKAFVGTWQLWLILVVYAVIRTLALGSVTGGYQGSIGEGLTSSTLERIFSLASLQRIVFPLNAEVFTPLKRLVKPLAVLYGLMFLLFAARVVLTKQKLTVLKVVAFATLWFVLVMVPTIPVWNLTESLQGSRFIYMGTAPLCLLIAAFLAPIWSAASNQSERPPSKVVALSGLSSVLSIAIVVFFGFIVFGNNSAWVHAGTELRALRDRLDSEVQKLAPQENLALLNLPHKYKGAHMLYNAATLSVLMAPPLTPTNIVKRVITFEPVLFGDDDLIRISRVRNMIAPGSKYRFVHWNRDTEQLDEVHLNPGETDLSLDQNCKTLTPIDIDARGNQIIDAKSKNTGAEVAPGGHTVKDNLVLLPPALNIEPTAIDFLDLCVSATTKAGGTAPNTVPVVIQWNGATESGFDAPENLITTVALDGKMHRMRIHASEHKKWLSRGKIHRLGITSPAPDAIVTVHGVALTNSRNSVPKLTPAGNFVEDESGVVRAGGKFGRFSYDASAVTGARGVTFEISKPNAWFEHYSNTYRDSRSCEKALKTWKETALSGAEKTFNLKELGGAGFYELRTAAVGDNGEVVGYFSDPIMFQLSH